MLGATRRFAASADAQPKISRHALESCDGAFNGLNAAINIAGVASIGEVG